MRKKYLFGLLLTLLLIIVTACSDAEAEGKNGDVEENDGKTYTLKFAVSQPDTHTMNQQMYTPFMEKVTELSEGRVQFEFYPAEQLGKIDDLLDLTGNGVTDLGIYIPTYYSSKMPLTSALMAIPGLFDNAYEGSMTYHELGKQEPLLESDFLSNGVRQIFTIASPPAELWTTGNEIKVPGDLEGLKVRVSGELANKAVSTLNASPINITMAEMYEGMERGVFDSMLLNAASTRDYGMADLVKYGTVGAKFGGGSLGIVINEKVFQSLPEDIQDILIEVGDEFTASVANYYDQYTQDVIQEFTEAGVNMYELSSEEVEEWQQFYSEFEKEWAEQQNNPDFDTVLEAFKTTIPKYGSE